MKPIQQKYKHVVLATDTVIFTVKDHQLKVLLIKMTKEPYHCCWAVPGGLVRFDESVDTSVKRILLEETGFTDVYLEQLYTFGRIDRDPFGRVVSVGYLALIPFTRMTLKMKTIGRKTKWFDIKSLPKLAYDHDEVIKCALDRLRNKLTYTNIVYSLLPEAFTLTQLQKMYEIILGRLVDKRNFRKKILSARLVEKTGRMRTGKACRPAALYRFVQCEYQMVQII